MSHFIAWYLILLLLSWLSMPLAFWLMPNLADRGFAFCRSLGILLWAYFFWLLASLGLLPNNLGGLLFALALVFLLGFWAVRKAGYAEILDWIRQNKSYVLSVEALFLVAFAIWALVRAANPAILGTEKPMELAFINAILRSPTFPPHDPWLSGYAISYYYFGYVMVAMMAKLANIPGGIAFNLGIAMLFAMSAVGAYGMVYNLLVDQIGKRVRTLFLPLFAPLYVLLVGNLEGFLEVLHARGLFWRKLINGEWVSPFWKWLDLVELTQPPALPLAWTPTRFLWWWRASRVVQDYDLAGNVKEIIDEFPAFSYLLADLHPHVLAMPFAFLAMAAALQIYRNARQAPRPSYRLSIPERWLAWLGSLMLGLGLATIWAGSARLSLRNELIGLASVILGTAILSSLLTSIRRNGIAIFFAAHTAVRNYILPVIGAPATILFYGLILGGLAFLNTWDSPFYVALTAAAVAVGNWQLIQPRSVETEVRNRVVVAGVGKLFKDFFWLCLVLGLLSVLLYLPFFVGFSSQAGGIIPNLIYPTRGAHLWVMFGTLLAPILLYFGILWKGLKPSLLRGFGVAAGILLLLWVLSLTFGFFILSLSGIGDIYLNSLGGVDVNMVIHQAFTRRLINFGGWLTLLFLLCASLTTLLRTIHPDAKTVIKEESPDQSFILLVILVGVLLALIPEFFYLRDQFGWRINTIFKFYYQAWLFWGMAAGYVTALLWQKQRSSLGLIFRIVMIGVFGVGIVYIVLGVADTTHGFNPPTGLTLNGIEALTRQEPDEMAAIGWLSQAADGVVAEAVSPTGGSYTNYARVSTLSGLPGVLGWVGHESQWRGGGKEMGSRQADLERLYCTRQWEEALEIIQKYNIQYVYIGSLERITYAPDQANCPTGLSEIKFIQYMDTVFSQGSVSIYRLPR